MKTSSRSDAVVKLGKKILAQFDKSEDRGILTSWMSHYVAELITRGENEKGTPTEDQARQACLDGILKLWSYRNSLPTGLRPFQNAEAAVQTLVRLTPSAEHSFYFRQALPPIDAQDEISADAMAWLLFAEAFDKKARAFIRLCMSRSFAISAPELRDWISLSGGLDDDPALDIELISQLVSNASDEELEDIANPESVKSAKVLIQLDEIIDSLVQIRKAISESDIKKESNNAAC